MIDVKVSWTGMGWTGVLERDGAALLYSERGKKADACASVQAEIGRRGVIGDFSAAEVREALARLDAVRRPRLTIEGLRIEPVQSSMPEELRDALRGTSGSAWRFSIWADEGNGAVRLPFAGAAAIFNPAGRLGVITNGNAVWDDLSPTETYEEAIVRVLNGAGS